MCSSTALRALFLLVLFVQLVEMCGNVATSSGSSSDVSSTTTSTENPGRKRRGVEAPTRIESSMGSASSDVDFSKIEQQNLELFSNIVDGAHRQVSTGSDGAIVLKYVLNDVDCENAQRYEEKEAESQKSIREAKREKRRKLMEKFAKERAERRREKRLEAARKTSEFSEESVWEQSYHKQEMMLKQWMEKTKEEKELIKRQACQSKKRRVVKRYTPEVMENWRIRWEKQEHNLKVWRAQIVEPKKEIKEEPEEDEEGNAEKNGN